MCRKTANFWIALGFLAPIWPDAGLAASAAVPLLARPAPGDECRTAIALAERSAGIPAKLLAAIGRVESGRRDPVSGNFAPWPWTVNAEGQGSFYDSKADAIAAVRQLRAGGMRSIDVGCMQINLMHHPNAFASLEAAFDPVQNAAYAAKFLNDLHTQTGEWTRAAAMYHSANPERGEPYRQKVLAAWPDEKNQAGQQPASPAWETGGAFGAGGTGFVPVHRNAPPNLPGSATPGRGLDAYRAAPITSISRLRRLGG